MCTIASTRIIGSAGPFAMATAFWFQRTIVSPLTDDAAYCSSSSLTSSASIAQTTLPSASAATINRPFILVLPLDVLTAVRLIGAVFFHVRRWAEREIVSTLSVHAPGGADKFRN